MGFLIFNIDKFVKWLNMEEAVLNYVNLHNK